MIQIDEYRYKAEEGCFIARKKDGFIMGEDICLGGDDVVDNYTDYIYTPEEYEEFYHPTKPSIDEVRYNKLAEISNYDISDKVNLFYINDIPMWLDRTSRTSLMARFNAEKAKGLEVTNIWYEGMNVVLPIENAVSMLLDLEIYASQCFDNTQKHLYAVKQLKDIEDIITYDYTTGYPEKLNLVIS
jgi:hypothetical protein